MRTRLQALPRFGETWSFLYVERTHVEREQHAIVFVDARGRIAVPAAALAALMLGPGTTLTHAAVTALADSACSIVWCGEEGVRVYATGLGETRRAANLLRQAEACTHPEQRLEVVFRLYAMRFAETLEPGLTLEQVRGREGVRVRETYARLSRETGLTWSGRAYKPGAWNAADPVNRALSAANACLYGLCHAALAATGFSPALGFIHTGKALSFVYDIADLYKCDVTIPVAFQAAKDGFADLEGRVRRACRDTFRRTRLIERIVPDVQRALGLKPESVHLYDLGDDSPADSRLWDPQRGELLGGRNYGDQEPS